MGGADFLTHIEEIGKKMARWTVVQFLIQIREFAKKRNKPALKLKKPTILRAFAFVAGSRIELPTFGL